jgi:hypothetical protein
VSRHADHDMHGGHLPTWHSHNRILIPERSLARRKPEHAKAYAQNAITALAALPQSQWRMQVTQTSQVQDADPITDNKRTDA